MGKNWNEFKENWPTIIIIAGGAALASALLGSFSAVYNWTGLPAWVLLITIVDIAALCFAVDIRMAHRRGERSTLRVSNPRTKAK